MKLRKVFLCFFLPFLLLGKIAFAFPDYPITYLGIEHGLSNNAVRCIYQDHNGFMWFGTYDGLNRYDGYSFKVFRNKRTDSNSLVHNIVSAITEDRNNHLWIGTRQGISRYSNLLGKFTTVTFQPAQNRTIQPLNAVVKDVKADESNNIFIGTEGSGLLYCRPGSTAASSIPLHNGGRQTNKYGIQSIRIDKKNRVWVIVQNQGLGMLDRSTMKLHLVSHLQVTATCMEMDNEHIWIWAGNMLYDYQITGRTMTKALDAEAGKIPGNVMSLWIDKNKNLWMGADAGNVIIWNTVSRKTDYIKTGDNKYAVNSGTVYAIYEDRELRKWMGTAKGGVNIIDPQKNRFRTVSHERGNNNSLSGDVVASLYEAPDNSLWIGTDGAGVNIWNRKTNRFKSFRHNPADASSLSDDHITSITADHRQNIWVATFSNGVNRFHKNTGRFQRYACINPVSGIENKVVYALLEDRDQQLWATTLRHGGSYGALYKYTEATGRFEAFDTNLSDLFTIGEDRNGTLWGGNLSQLVKIDKHQRRHSFYEIGYSVRAIREDNAGNFWIGTEGGGLLLFDRNKNEVVARYTTNEGLSNDAVLTILDDGKGNLWMSTYNGLSKFNLAKKTFTNYYQGDGLQGNQFNFNAAALLQSGEMAIGGIRGFSIFHPHQVASVHTMPRLLLTGITVDNVPVEQGNDFVASVGADQIEALRVPYNQAIFSFNFTALEYSSPNKISYAYFFDGWDKKWNYAGNNRNATYTHLREGTYTFRVKSTNAEGVWNTSEIAIKVTVLPPLYRSWWAYLLYLVFIGSAVYYYLQYRSKQTRLRYEIKIATLNAENERTERQRSLAELEKERMEREKRETELALEKVEKEKGLAELAVEKAELEKERALREKEHTERENERILNEQEREMNEKKTSFFTNISHEFRAPLTLIINPLKDVLKKKGEEHAAEDKELGTVYRNARRLLSLVDQLLLFRKAESGLDRIKPSKLNLPNLASEVYLCFTQQAKSCNIDYTFNCPSQEIEIYADREKLEIILYNLLSNAIKYTPDGGRISFTITEQPQNIIIEVQDTGSGIPKEIGEKLFDKFYKAERTITGSKPGFGIGLFLVKHFSEQHKAAVSYHSEEGQGATFTLSLLKGKEHFGGEIIVSEHESGPVFLQELKEEALEDFSAAEDTMLTADMVTEKRSILIVDDDEQIRQYLVQLFRDKYVIQQAADGEKGLKEAQKHLPDLIISDVHMQGMNGIELCKQIKGNDSLNHIPVILLTASTSDELKLKGVEGGADDYITKPFDNDLLIARVTNLLKSRSNLQKYFYNEITLNKDSTRISPEYKEFLDKCIQIVEKHLDDENFSVKTLLSEMGMSHSNLFRKVKSVSGQSVNVFIRFIRLRKAAELFINSGYNINETAFMVGINDTKYFREQFNKLFGMNPSEYIKRYRKVHGKQFTVNRDSIKIGK